MRPFEGLLLLVGLAGLFQARADAPVVFRSDVSLVRVDAQVLDRDNRAITGLTPRDFVLYDGGRPQKIESVDSENLPVDLLLLLDVSASMRPHIERIAAAAHEAMRQLRDQDRVAIMVFDRQSRVRMGFRSSQSSVDRELERLLDDESFRRGTDITLGLLDAADYVRREGRREARKAIVIVTDDQTERNRDVEGVSRALTRADAVLCALLAPDAIRSRGACRNPGGYPGGGGNGPLGGIIFGPPRGRSGGGDPGGGATGSRTLSAGTAEIARESGGDTMQVGDAYALQDTLARIRQRYALHFYVPPGARAGEQREIEVELADSARNRYPAAEVLYRRAYYAPASVSANGSGSGEPAVVTRSGESGPASDDPDRPRLRRPGVSPVPDRSRQGPLDPDSPSNTSASPTTQAAPSPARAPDPNAPGWRKARPDDLPPPPQL
ncbi:MAG: VWA domain-containing protein [Acidobacteriia bacterium]|nr:VWA domain-containing protein [Terriglobia bacterium]